eukprot:2811328-Pyramimonas_sp.AAC.1
MRRGEGGRMTSRGFKDQGCGGAGGGCEDGSGSAWGRERSGSRAGAVEWWRNSSNEEYEPFCSR